LPIFAAMIRHYDAAIIFASFRYYFHCRHFDCFMPLIAITPLLIRLLRVFDICRHCLYDIIAASAR